MAGVTPGPPSPTLQGELVRLEPLDRRHLPGLLAAATEDRAHFGFTPVPDGRAGLEAYLERAEAGRREGSMVPFATVGAADGRVLGSTRFACVERWDWPPGHPQAGRSGPDVVEIGFTWLAGSALRSGANLEAKLLMLAHAFETWEVHRVRFRTDRRNERSRLAIEGLGAGLDGILRADLPGADGTVRDSAYFSILAVDWPRARSTIRARLDRRAPAG